MSQRPPWAASLRSSPHPLQYPARRRRHPPPTCCRRSSATPCPSGGRRPRPNPPSPRPPPGRSHRAALRPRPQASTPTRSTCSFPTSRCCRPPSAQKGISLSQSLSHCIVYTDNFQQAWSEKNKSIPIYMYTTVAQVKWKEQIFIFLYANDG